MTTNDLSKIAGFFAAISGWREAYAGAWLCYVGVRRENGELLVAAARLYLGLGPLQAVKPSFRAGHIEAGVWPIPLDTYALGDIVESLASQDGLLIDGIGKLKLPTDERSGIYVAPPTLLHPEGISNGNRLAVLSIHGKNWADLFPQPESDWLLKGADQPYDSLGELTADYSLGTLRESLSAFEVVAGTAIEVLSSSAVSGTNASLGLWLSNRLDRSQAKLGYRVLSGGKVHSRGSIYGQDMDWQSGELADSGTTSIAVPLGSIVHCIASYAGQAHHVQWRVDPTFFQNPRAAVLGQVDQGLRTMRSYLLPDLPPKGKAADDFEAAIGWLVWSLGFAPAAFGTNPKTRDAFDIIAVAPRGDFIVVECTLGLLRSESKLSKLGARAATLRETLATSNMRHVRVLPVIVTAMTAEQVKSDADQAAEIGVLVLTREDLENSFEELLRTPNADDLFERALARLSQVGK
ncbi:hypothetical protein [Paucibacter sp. XJ19-41]|uniref:hypothetical protein n=1 Tax=Paucibacter sp. XJ19-41 TaxID=2927824 RepID=UPI0023498F23|nr:hypothetical protein [Paucibacter sp. XJ19-41]MDC6170839.1 hypothetical protein [Paucibacter sp. XJ19-41]